MKKSTIVGLIIILGLALMVLVSLFRDRPLSSVQFQESQESVDQVALSGARRSLGRWTPRPVGNGLSGFEGWYEQLPDWLASNSFPAYVIPETRSLAVSLRALYAETNATPRAIQAGYDLGPSIQHILPYPVSKVSLGKRGFESIVFRIVKQSAGIQ